MDQLAGLEDAQELALVRFQVLQPHLEQNLSLRSVAQAAGIPYRTAHRWLAKYRLSGLAGLARKARDDRGARRAVSTEFQMAIEGLARQDQSLPMSALYRQVQGLALDLGVKIPSKGTVFNIVRDLPADRLDLAGPSVPLQHDRLPGESVPAFRAYTIYRNLGSNRSLARAYDAYRGDVPHGQRPGQWSLWSVKHRWVERAGTFDVRVLEARQKQREIRMLALEARRFDFELENQDRLERRVLRMDKLLDNLEATPLAGVKIEKVEIVHSLRSGTTTTTHTKTIVKALDLSGYALTVQVCNETAGWAINGVRDVTKKEIADKSVTGTEYQAAEAAEDAAPTEVPPCDPRRVGVEETASFSLARTLLKADEDVFGWKQGMDPQETTCRKCRKRINPPASLKGIVFIGSKSYQDMMRENSVYSCESCSEHFCSACMAGLHNAACPACKNAHGW